MSSRRRVTQYQRPYTHEVIRTRRRQGWFQSMFGFMAVKGWDQFWRDAVGTGRGRTVGRRRRRTVKRRR